MLKNTKSKNRIKGNFGENIVNNYVNKCGYKMLFRNFNCGFGEIDIIFKDKDELVFAEVKTRTSIKYGFPAESVTLKKQKHILNSARFFLHKYKVKNIAIRFDVIEVYLYDTQKPVINHIKNVFW